MSKREPVSVLILSHTELGSGLCTNLKVKLREKGYVQVRPRIPGGYGGLTYERLGLHRPKDRRLWQAGRWARMTPRVVWQNGRPTHPEDVLLNPEFVLELDRDRKRLDHEQLIEAVEPFTFDDAEELFPAVDVCNNKLFVAEQPLDQSVGYVRMSRVRIFQDGEQWRVRLSKSEAGERRVSSAPIRGEELLRMLADGSLEEGSHNDVVVRLALAGPWKPGDSDWDTRRCYVMCSDILFRD